MLQEDRSNALGKALEGGKAEGVSGWRRSLKSTRFQIKEATLFNISSPTGAIPPPSSHPPGVRVSAFPCVMLQSMHRRVCEILGFEASCRLAIVMICGVSNAVVLWVLNWASSCVECGHAGEVLGQGAKIGQWEYEDGRKGGPDVPPEPPSDEPVAASDISEAGGGAPPPPGAPPPGGGGAPDDVGGASEDVGASVTGV